MNVQRALVASGTLAAISLLPMAVLAHSVGQVQTAKRISQQTVVLLDPQGNPTPGGTGTDTKAEVGDILTFTFQFTPVPNNATRGAHGYITEYVPPNTEVVGVRIIDAAGNTIKPRRGPQMDDGWGPKGDHGFDSIGLEEGSMSAVYADTGIFFSTDPRTARVPNDAFITVFNGIPMSPSPTGAGGLGDLLGTNGPYYAHNQWDLIQAYAYGVGGGNVCSDGRGNTPFLYGSAVAGPDTHYLYEKVAVPQCRDGISNDADGLIDWPADPDCASELDDDETNSGTPETDGPIGPWQRIRYTGSEIGTGGPVTCQSCTGDYERVGVPTMAGWDLSPDNPLPPDTNAIRYAVGELVVGQEYFAEVSLRVTGLPLDPNMGQDVNCSEVFGGDAAMPQNGQDNTWRYFVPGPACVQLNLQFDLSVDKILALNGDVLTYRIEGKNLSVNTMTNVVVADKYENANFVQMIQGPTPTINNKTLTWPAMTLNPGEGYVFEWEMTAGGDSELNRATYTSDQLPAPGFSVVAYTTVDAEPVLSQTVAVMPTSTSAGSNVSYVATVINDGTGAAQANGFVEIVLPTGFAFCGVAQGCTAPTVNGNTVVNPTLLPGNTLLFTNGLQDVPPFGGTMDLAFDVTVGAAVPPGLYTVDMRSEFKGSRDIETSVFEVAPLLVDAVQSEPPVLDDPVLAGATSVTGVTSEGVGAVVTVFVNGNSVPSVVAGAGGVFSATVPTLFAGQHLTATAMSAGEIESVQSAPPVIVQGLAGNTHCSDGNDNDGDGLIDFPDDPGCTSPSDPDETDIPECSDGEDNDNDGLVDFPDDPSCSSYLDDDESGPPACSDGEDNDGDGQVDFPDDPGCQSADDVNEDDIAACSNGLDDDGDGDIDYPLDSGCDGPHDDSEEPSPGTGGAGGAGGGGEGGAAGPGAGGSSGNGTPPDLGGIDPASVAGQDGGCSCRVAGRGNNASSVGWLALLAVLIVRRRRS